MYLLISALRGFSQMERSAREGKWKRGLPMAHDPCVRHFAAPAQTRREGKTLGICGLGGIGKALARRALAFDMRVRLRGPRSFSSGLFALFRTI